jgi:hypothetical protein
MAAESSVEFYGEAGAGRTHRMASATLSLRRVRVSFLLLFLGAPPCTEWLLLETQAGSPLSF